MLAGALRVARLELEGAPRSHRALVGAREVSRGPSVGVLERLERGVHDQRRFVADASHELRTPLAVMLSEIEVSIRDPHVTTGSRARCSRACSKR